MTRYQTVVLLGVLVGLVSFSGASCNQYLFPARDELSRLPPALPAQPTLDQVVQVLNGNSSRIQNFSANQASLSVPGIPSLRTNIAYERPMRFRLRSDLALVGQQLDVGSNDELFWFWLRQMEPPAIYYCRHGQYASSPVRRTIPIDPYWLIETLGLYQLDPNQPHQGPRVWPDGRLEVRTPVNTEQGTMTKVTFLDGRQGLVLEQQIYDSRNQLVARAISGRYRRDPLTQVFMPSSVELATTVPNGQPFSLRIDLGPVSINRPLANPEQLWAMPSFEGSTVIDLCNASPAPAPAQTPPPSPLTLRPGQFPASGPLR